MAGPVRFTSTRLAATGKMGKPKCDNNGYYEICLGALNIFNSKGEYYTLNGAEKLFQQSSSFMRRMTMACLKSEEGHPKPGNMSQENFISRLLRIEEPNVCAHIKKVELDFDYAKKVNNAPSQDCVGIVGWVKPAGPLGKSLEDSFNNPDEEVCFSIRAFTKDYWERGTKYRVLDEIVTWDHVTEPGISLATKYNSAATESFEDILFTKGMIERIINDTPSDMMAMESGLSIARSLLASMVETDTGIMIPRSAKW